MLWYFFAFFFLFLSFEWQLPFGTVDFLPDFIGYTLIIIGSFQLRHENSRFLRSRRVAFVLLVITAALFGLDLFGVVIDRVIRLALNTFITVSGLYTAYEFTEGCKTLERSLETNVGASNLSSAWIILCMGNFLLFFIEFLPALALPCLLLHLLAFSWFESSIFHTNRRLSGKE